MEAKSSVRANLYVSDKTKVKSRVVFTTTSKKRDEEITLS